MLGTSTGRLFSTGCWSSAVARFPLPPSPAPIASHFPRLSSAIGRRGNFQLLAQLFLPAFPQLPLNTWCKTQFAYSIPHRQVHFRFSLTGRLKETFGAAVVFHPLLGVEPPRMGQ
jgi:hypothetical protein